VPSDAKPLVLPKPPRAFGRSDNLGSLVRPLSRDAFGREIEEPEGPAPDPFGDQPASPTRREAATESIGRRAGALSDELDFPEFVASLVHGTFDAIVDSSIRQMESFADLVAAVAKPIDQFSQENVTLNQARDWLVEQYPQNLALAREAESFQVVPRPRTGGNQDEELPAPEWLADFGLAGEELTPEFLEEQLVPLARERVARQRLQTLATMVLLGMNRVVVNQGWHYRRTAAVPRGGRGSHKSRLCRLRRRRRRNGMGTAWQPHFLAALDQGLDGGRQRPSR
jgi:hypothetical protein